MGIGYRIKEAREKKGLTQTELGKKIGVTGSAITNYENNVSHPKETILYKLLEILDVEPNYLFQDEMNLQNKTISLQERNLIERYNNLDDHGQKIVDLVLSEELNRIKKEKSATKDKLSKEIKLIARNGKEITEEELKRNIDNLDNLDDADDL